MEAVSKTLTIKKISHCDRRALYRYRAFYLTYPQIVGTLSPQFGLLPQLARLGEDSPLLRLSYNHWERLVAITEPGKRRFYEERCLQSGWSVRELKRQVASLYYERTALSTDKTTLQTRTEQNAERQPLALEIRDPYIFEFLGLKPA